MREACMPDRSSRSRVASVSLATELAGTGVTANKVSPLAVNITAANFRVDGGYLGSFN